MRPKKPVGFAAWISLWFVTGSGFFCETGYAAEPPGTLVKLEAYAGPATVASTSLGLHKLELVVEPKTERAPLVIRVELPITGPHAWPIADVEVRDGYDQAVPVRRGGIEWHKLLIPVPAERATYVVQAAKPPESLPALPSERRRSLADPATGLHLGIARWYDGHRAALSIRFDDSHPSHLSTVIPLLREYGFRGTFMINPGTAEPGSRQRLDFEVHRAEWEACARRGDQEFANHTAHHRGAGSDAAMEAEIREAAEVIWRLSPGRSKLAALNLGGGTMWETTRPLRYYLDKYFLFDASQNSMGMDDAYGNRVAVFRKALEQHIQRGLWLRVHYHSIGEGLSSSEANFRAVLDIAGEHEGVLWIAGMADIYKYQSARNGAALLPLESDSGHLSFQLKCLTDPELYDQPLTLEIAGPASRAQDKVEVTDAQGAVIPIRVVKSVDSAVLRCEVAAQTAIYTVRLLP